MKDFFTSPFGLACVIFGALAFLAIVVLWRNISWAPRGVTPEDMRKKLWAGIVGVLPESKTALWVLGVAATVLVVGGGIWWLWPSATSDWSSPSLATVWMWTKSYWLYIMFVFVGALIALTVWGDDHKAMLQTTAWGIVAMLFAVIPLLAWVVGNQSSECITGHPCELQQKSDGSTVPVSIQSGQWICFDTTFWDNLSQLGYRTSFRGGPEKLYGCTRDSVLSGKCNERMGDTFRFTPTKGVPLPKYWFTSQQDGHNC